MKRVIASIGATVASLVLLLGFKTHSPEVTTTATKTEETASDDSTTTAAVAPSSAGRATIKSTTSTTIAKTSSTKTVTGASVSTRWGPVQVKVTMSGSTIKAIDVIDYPQNNNRDIQINRYAVPELISQALEAQSANINGVSGATYTTGGFIQSLQSALSKA